MTEEKPNPLVEFFREGGAAYGRQGDHEGWTPEETAVAFLREHLACPLIAGANWDKVLDRISAELRITLARHPKVGNAITAKEADELVSDLASKLTYDIHKMIDPSYDT